MGHATRLQCPRCFAIQEVELKDLFVNGAHESLNFRFYCDCGFSQQFQNAPVEEIVPLLSDTQEPHIADYLGISRESWQSYIWPPDIRDKIDKQRRALPNSEAKRLLRHSALRLPRRYDDRWWLVYDVTPQVVFDPKSNEYGVVGVGGKIDVVGDIVAVISLLTAQS